MKHLPLLFLMISLNAFGMYEVLKVPRSDGSLITAYLKYPEGLYNLSILLNVSGSACRSEYAPGDVSDTYRKYKFAQLTVEKYGIDENFTPEQCGEVYRRKNNIFQRRDDHIQVLNFLKSSRNLWNGRVYIIGGSEGAVVAPLIASSGLNTKAMALWAGARGMTMQEELLLNVRKGNKVCSDTPMTEEVYTARFQDISTHPESSALWCSDPDSGSVNSYQWWSHILPYNPLKDFLKFEGSIYAAHGGRDKMIPVESARVTQDAFIKKRKENLTVKEYPDLDHGCYDSKGKNHCNKVFGAIHQWLLINIKKDNDNQP